MSNYFVAEVIRCYGSELCTELFDTQLFGNLDGTDNLLNDDDLGLNFAPMQTILSGDLSSNGNIQFPPTPTSPSQLSPITTSPQAPQLIIQQNAPLQQSPPPQQLVRQTYFPVLHLLRFESV